MTKWRANCRLAGPRKCIEFICFVEWLMKQKQRNENISAEAASAANSINFFNLFQSINNQFNEINWCDWWREKKWLICAAAAGLTALIPSFSFIHFFINHQFINKVEWNWLGWLKEIEFAEWEWLAHPPMEQQHIQFKSTKLMELNCWTVPLGPNAFNLNLSFNQSSH